MQPTPRAPQPRGVCHVRGRRGGADPKGPAMLDLQAIAPDSPETIPVLRNQIDALDEAITRLICERARLSRRVQAARIASGGVRVELGREREVHHRYRSVLG